MRPQCTYDRMRPGLAATSSKNSAANLPPDRRHNLSSVAVLLGSMCSGRHSHKALLHCPYSSAWSLSCPAYNPGGVGSRCYLVHGRVAADHCTAVCTRRYNAANELQRGLAVYETLTLPARTAASRRPSARAPTCERQGKDSEQPVKAVKRQ